MTDEAGGEETADDADDAPEVDETPKAKAQRLRMEIQDFDPDGRKLLLAARKYVAENPGTDFRTALEMAGMEFPAKAAVAAAQEDAIPAPAPEAGLAAAQAELDALEEKFDEADASFDHDAKKKLRREIRAAEQKLADARAETRVAERQLQVKVAEHTALVAAAIPDLADDASPLGRKASALYAERQQSNPAFFKDPKWPQKMAIEVWLEVNPDKPFPALTVPAKAPAKEAAPSPNGKPSAAAEKPRVPVKPGKSAAMLAGGTAGHDLGSLEAKVRAGTATNEELDRYAMVLEGRSPR